MTNGNDPTRLEDDGELADIPDWEDEYLDRVSDRLMTNYDLEKGYSLRGRTYPMYGKMLVKNQKQFFVAALRYGYHESTEHLFVSRSGHVSVSELESDVALAHDLADEWITLDDDHFETEFTFVHVVDEITEDVADYVESLDERTLLKAGFKGHYEPRLIVVAPEREEIVASDGADVWRAFRLWDAVEEGRELDFFERVKQLVR